MRGDGGPRAARQASKAPALRLALRGQHDPRGGSGSIFDVVRGTMPRMDAFRKLIRWVAIALVALAIADQLRRPSEERTWEGTVIGFVPYDFRMPTIERARSRWWNPEEPRLFVPQVFGLGWTINVARLVGPLRDRTSAA